MKVQCLGIVGFTLNDKLVYGQCTNSTRNNCCEEHDHLNNLSTDNLIRALIEVVGSAADTIREQCVYCQCYFYRRDWTEYETVVCDLCQSSYDLKAYQSQLLQKYKSSVCASKCQLALDQKKVSKFCVYLKSN